MEVIPLVLDEETVFELSDEQLAALAECSTELVKDQVLKYLNDPNANEVVKNRVGKAYARQLEIIEYMQDVNTKKEVELVQDLSYLSISPQLSIEELTSYKNAIEDILNNELAVPYIAPINGALIKDLRDEIAEEAKEKNSVNLRELAIALKKQSFLFRDSPHEPYKGTVVKKIVRNSSKYEILLRGINFMLEKKKAHASPSSWRYL